jgi:phage terminase large subunit-like protein
MTPVLHLHGTTRAGAEWVRDQVGPAEVPSTLRIALIGPTAAHVRSLMIEGDGGLLEVCPLSNRPRYGPARRRLTWPNGAIATCYSADKPDQLRGPQHHIAWADELASWRFVDAWDQLQFGLRLGDDPRCVVTTTPRPTPIIRELLARTKDGKRRRDVAATRGSTYENSGNLARTFLEKIVAKYEGTRLGRQELYAEVLDDTPGAGDVP